MMRSSFLACAVLATNMIACSAADTSGSGDAGSDREQPPDAANVGEATDASAVVDAHAPPAPSCTQGDRSEWSGTIPSTLLAVAVCSKCGETYVVAASGSASAAEVTIDNGTKTLKTTIPANGTATTATIADDPSDGTVTVCGTSGTQGCLPVKPANKEYCNPYRGVSSLVPERIDQGVDYAGAGPIYAMGPGKIDVYIDRTDTGWPGGTFVSYELTEGPASGKVIFLAENVDLNKALHAGSYVFSGTVLGTLMDASPDSESGWGVAGKGYTAEHACYTEGCMTALGVNFNDLLVCLKTPSGTKGTSGCCTSSAGYPSNWCALLDAWQ